MTIIDGGKPKQQTANAPDENNIAGAFLLGMKISQKRSTVLTGSRIDQLNRQ